MSANVFEAVARLKDLFSAKIKKMEKVASGSFDRMTEKAKKFADSAKDVTKSGGLMSKAFDEGKKGLLTFAKTFGPATLVIGTFTVAIRALSSAITFISDVTADFEQSLSRVKATIQPTSKEFNKLTKEAQRLGETTSFTATESSKAFTEMGKLGLKTSEILSATSDVLNVAVIGETDLATASKVAIGTMRQFGLQADDVSNITDVMAKSFTSSALDLEKFREAMKFVGTTARLSGLDVIDTTSMLAVLSDNMIDASTAGTSLNQALAQFAKPSSRVNKLFATMGMESADVVTKMKWLAESGVDVGDVFELLDIRAGRAMNVLVNNMDKVEEFRGKTFVGISGEAKKFADQVLDNVRGKTILLESAQEGLGLAIGSAFGADKTARIEFYTKVVGEATAFIKEHEHVLRAISKVFTTVFLGALDLTIKSVYALAKAVQVLFAPLTLVADHFKEVRANTEKLTDVFEDLGKVQALVTLRSQFNDLKVMGEDVTKVMTANGVIEVNTKAMEELNRKTKELMGYTFQDAEGKSMTLSLLRKTVKVLKEKKRLEQPVMKPSPSGAGIGDDVGGGDNKDMLAQAKMFDQLRQQNLKRSIEGEKVLLVERFTALNTMFAGQNEKLLLINDEFLIQLGELNKKEMEKINSLSQEIRLEALDDKARELELLRLQFEERKKIIGDNQTLLVDAENIYYNKREAIHQKFHDKQVELAKKEKQLQQDKVDAWGNLTLTIISSTGKIAKAMGASARAQQQIAMIEAIIHGALAIQKALSSAPPPINFINAGAVGVATSANVATIASQSFEKGGFPVGKNAMVRVNEAGQESILNADATSAIGRGNISRLNAGQGLQGSNVTNDIVYSPTIHIGKDSGDNISEVLRNSKEEFVEYFEGLKSEGYF